MDILEQNADGFTSLSVGTHSLDRTSPKGQPFLGTCRLCGAQNLKAVDAEKPCPKNNNPEQAVLDLICNPPPGEKKGN